jgi:hypothetical protein
VKNIKRNNTCKSIKILSKGVVSIYERNLRRQFLASLSMILRWPIFLFLAVCRASKINCLFTVYPGSEEDLEGYTFPGIRNWQVRYNSGKPFVAGIITSGHGYGRGLVLALPNTIDQIKDDKKLVGTIMRRLNFARKVTGAKTIGIAGQGPRYFKSHHPFREPFIYGLRGRVFSVVETVQRIYEKHHLPKAGTAVGVLGIGEVGEAIIQNLRNEGYKAEGVKISTVDGRVVISGEGLATLKKADLVVVQTPKGDDVIPYYADLKKSAILVDDTHPRITVMPKRNKFYKVAIGRPGVVFKPPLPGYKNYWIPGCVQESMVVAETGRTNMQQHEFNTVSKELGFFVHLIEGPG